MISKRRSANNGKTAYNTAYLAHVARPNLAPLPFRKTSDIPEPLCAIARIGKHSGYTPSAGAVPKMSPVPPVSFCTVGPPPHGGRIRGAYRVSILLFAVKISFLNKKRYNSTASFFLSLKPIPKNFLYLFSSLQTKLIDEQFF